MFIAAQFTIAKYWKQPKCPSVNEWIKKTMVHLHNGILYSREKENGSFLQHLTSGHSAGLGIPLTLKSVPSEPGLLLGDWNC